MATERTEERKEKARERARLWRLAHPGAWAKYAEDNRERLRKGHRDRYWSNPEKAREESRKRRMANPKKHLDCVMRCYKKSERYAKTMARRRYHSSQEYRDNRILENQRRASERRLFKYKATPPWADKSAILGKYSLAIRATRESGIKHVVDHFYPLRPRSKAFSGLHVPWNLRVVIHHANLMKSDKVTQNMLQRTPR